MSDKLYLLDTNVLLVLVRGGAHADHIDETFGLRASKTRPMISVVTHGEIRVLAHRNSWGDKKLAVLDRALTELVTVDINHPDVIDAYVEIDIFSQGYPKGDRNMGKNDLWISACAKASQATLLSMDKDILHLKEIMSIEYVDQSSSQTP